MSKCLTEDLEDWTKDLPLDLIEVIEVLRESFEDAHFRAGFVTQVLCYSTLHAEDVEKTREYILPLQQIKSLVGVGATTRFHQLLEIGTLSSIAKAYFDLYLDAVTSELAGAFNHLIEIAAANDERLSIPHVAWAEFQAKHLIRSQAYRIGIWIKQVCDRQIYDASEDEDEQIFWRKWQAPKMLLMAPFMHHPYDPSTASERMNIETSLEFVDRLTERYVLHVEGYLRRRKGEVLIEIAKKPKLASPVNDLHNSSQGTTTPEPAILPNSPDLRREGPKRRKTQMLHGNWQKAYLASVKRRPDMSDVWHAQQIAKSQAGNGSSMETIRKNMK